MERQDDLEELIEKKAKRRAGKSNQYMDDYTSSKKRGGDRKINEVIRETKKDSANLVVFNSSLSSTLECQEA
jgi:hypothetical protein